MKKLILIMAMMVLILASFGTAAVTFSDNFERADNNAVGNGWTESQIGFAIYNNQLNTTGTRGAINRADTSAKDYRYWCTQYTQVPTATTSLFYLQISESATLEHRFNGDGTISKFSGGVAACGSIADIVAGDWICQDTNGTYDITWYSVANSTNNYVCSNDNPRDDGQPLDTLAYDTGTASAKMEANEVCLADTIEDCVGVAPPAGSSINISTPLPLNGESFNTISLNINATVNATDSFNCSLYVDNVLNDSQDNFTGGEDRFVNFTLDFSVTAEEDHDYYINCYDSSTSTNSTNSTFYIDNILPNLEWYVPLNNNGTKINLNYSQTFTSNITIYDPNLYSYEYNITYLNGTSIINFTNDSLTGLTNVSIIETVNLSLYVGALSSVVTVCDGHTNNEIDFSARIYDKELQFAEESIKIYPSNKNNYNYVDFELLDDRYSFSFDSVNPATTHHFYVEAEEYIDVLDGLTGYEGHLVIGNKWLDFVTEGTEYVSIERITNNKVRVEVKLLSNRQHIKFNSIGELNCVTETRDLFVFEESIDYDNQTLSYYTTQHDLSIDYNATYFSGYPMIAYLVYNGTSYNATQNAGTSEYTWSYNHTTPTISVDTNYTFYWNYTLDGTTYFQSDTFSQQVFNPRITNCSEGGKIISFIINEENLLKYINADIDVDFTYWNPDGNTSQRGNFGYTFENTYNATVCMFPTFATLNADAYVINEVNTSYSHRYFLVNASLTNLSTNPREINLYNFIDTTNKNTMEVNVVDQYYNPISDVVVKLQRYYPSGTHVNTSVNYAHSWQNVQVDKSDEFGQTVFHISDSGDTDYYFILESEGSIVKQTATLKLLCPDPTDCKITFQIDTSADNSFYDLFDSFDWNYNEITEIVTVNWNDPTLLTSSIGITVTQEKSDGQLIICEQVFATPTGTYTCNTTGYNGLLRVTAYRTASPLVKFLDEIIDKYTAALSTQLNGEGAFWGALIFIAVVTASATSVIGVVVASIIALVVIFISGITSIITLSFLVMAIIVGLIIAFKLRR